jgi:hypothetical protein
MATYREIQDYVRMRGGFIPKTCWIAHVMSDYKLTTRQARNRISPTRRKFPCPEERRPAIVAALQHFRMIGSN